MNLNQTAERKSKSTIGEVKVNESKVSPKLNINKLISRYKKEKTKEKTETIIFVGLACVLVIISGILVSL